MTKEGDKAYSYGWLDKVMEIAQGGKITNSYSYGMDGQIATANISGKQESFIWDGLALLKRDTTEYVNEPSVTGGNPILANGKGLFNDMLGTTLGKYDGKKFIDNQRTSFGSGSREGFFTGKPHIAGLGYAFLFRNYRSELGKWQTADPLGYPDGWNNLAYCKNMVVDCIDWLGAVTVVVLPKADSGKSLDATEELIVGYYEQEQASGSTATLVYATNYNDAKQQLEAISSQEEITQLTFSGHGAAGLQNVGSVNNTSGDVSISATQTNDFFQNISFSDNASIWYEGCNTGNNLGPANLADSTAASTGTTTYAPMGVTTWGYQGSTYYRELYDTYHVVSE